MLEIKLIDLVLEMGFSSSYGVVRDAINQGKVSVDSKIITDHREAVNVNEESVVDMDTRSMIVGATHPYFTSQKFNK